jgi:serine phosphatase RsbU (regulator of sigma subunit)
VTGDVGGVNTVGRDIDYAALFAATPSPCMVLTPELIIVAVNAAYLEITGRERHELLGRHVFAAFPANPANPDADGMRNLTVSMRRAFDTGERDIMAPQKYDIPVPGRPGVFQERYWSTINTPVPGAGGTRPLLIHRVEDVTAFIRDEWRYRPWHGECSREPGAELYARARELHELNERLRQANAQEREVAVTLQQSMLPTVSAERFPGVAARYLPAVSALNVCGDWYELVDLGEDRLAVAVGDVVGHGLVAAGVMGQLRSALSAAIRAVDGPARALEVVGHYALSIEGALATTAVQAVIDRGARTITYSCAGHPPPLLLRPDHTVELLDQATDPPLGARPWPHARPQAGTPCGAGATLVFYTDGLIERRGGDLDEGMARLREAAMDLAGEPLPELCDQLVDRLVHGRPEDDVALAAIRLVPQRG